MELTIGKRIMKNRKRLGLTQDQLAEQLGVTAQAVSKWENDQSCPDITILPKLAEIFGTSTDALLGCAQEAQVIEAEVVEDNAHDGLHIQNGNWEFRWDGGRKNALGLAVLALCVGALYLLTQIFMWELSFWDILWPATLLVFGLFGLVPKFSVFRLGCALVGGYFLASKILAFPLNLDNGVIIAALILLFGFALLADAVRKSKKPHFRIQHNGGSFRNEISDFEIDDTSFEYSACFGSYTQLIELPVLSSGDISISFGQYTVDLSGVEKLDDCHIDASCNFGELQILVPKRYCVKSDNSTAFANICTNGTPDSVCEGIIHLDASANFGEISIQYI